MSDDTDKQRPDNATARIAALEEQLAAEKARADEYRDAQIREVARLREVLGALLVWADWVAERRTPCMSEPNTGAREQARAVIVATPAQIEVGEAGVSVEKSGDQTAGPGSSPGGSETASPPPPALSFEPIIGGE